MLKIPMLAWQRFPFSLGKSRKNLLPYFSSGKKIERDAVRVIFYVSSFQLFLKKIQVAGNKF